MQKMMTYRAVLVVLTLALGGLMGAAEAPSTSSSAGSHSATHASTASAVRIVDSEAFTQHQQRISGIESRSLEAMGLSELAEFHLSTWMFWVFLGLGVLAVVGVLVWYRMGYLNQMPISWKLGVGVSIMLALTLSIGFESHIFQAKLHKQEAILEHAAAIDFQAEHAGRAELGFLHYAAYDSAKAEYQAEELRHTLEVVIEEVEAIAAGSKDEAVNEASQVIHQLMEHYVATFEQIAHKTHEIRELRERANQQTVAVIDHMEEAVHGADAEHDRLVQAHGDYEQIAHLAEWSALLERIEVAILRAAREQSNYIIDHDPHHIHAMEQRLGEAYAAIESAQGFLENGWLSEAMTSEGEQVLAEATTDVRLLQDTTTTIVEDDLAVTYLKFTSDAELAEVELAAEALLHRAKTEYQATSAQATRMSLLMIGLAVGVGILVAVTMSLSIVKPIKDILPLFRGMADGDMTGRMATDRKDEFGKLGTMFNDAMFKINDLLCRLIAATQEVAAASTEVAATAEEMARGTDDQRGQVTTVSAAIEEMSATVMEVARQASDANQTASQAGQQASEGGQIVSQTVEAMTSIAAVVNHAAEAVSALGDRADQIGAVIDVINDIADQTNLLALNAAIEAARAGEHGRGFAVVADEVRKLAERTSQATDEVSESIKAIQGEAESTVTRMSTGTERVNAGVACAHEAGEALQMIVEGSSGVASLIQGIASSTEQQSQASDDIARSVEQITAVSRQSAEGASQMAQAADQMARKSDELDRLIAQFKVDQVVCQGISCEDEG